MRFNPRARLDTGRVSDSGSGGGGLGGGGMRIPIPGGARTGGGIGGILLILLIVVLQNFVGGGSGGGGLGGGAFNTQQMADADTGRYDSCKTGADANDNPDCARVAFENSLRDYWETTFPEQTGQQFQPATVQTFSSSVSTACGNATSQVGPFYCPGDGQIYLDSSFFDDVLERELGGPDGGFVEGYVIGHEYGHHIQNLLGTMGKVKTQQGRLSDAVRLELQADCYAGMWAKALPQTVDDQGEQIFLDLSDEDIQLAIEAAGAVGDDRIQKKTQGQVTEESWTHGSAESRVKWFMTGYQNGTVSACNTWATDDL